MHITKIFKSHSIAYSFELFPPKSQEAAEQLFATVSDLSPLELAYVSVTYGAGGYTRDLTHELIMRIQRETDLTVVSHLTCVGSTKDEIRSILYTYAESGIENILALRGDPPKGKVFELTPKVLAMQPSWWHSSASTIRRWVLVWPAIRKAIRKPQTGFLKWTISRPRSMRVPTISALSFFR